MKKAVSESGGTAGAPQIVVPLGDRGPSLSQPITEPIASSSLSSSDFSNDESEGQRRNDNDVQVDSTNPRLSLDQSHRVVICIILIYTGYYFCRTDLSVTLPSLTSHHPLFTGFVAGTIISYGYCAYAVGKLVNGMALYRYGPKIILHACLFGSVVATLLLSLRDLGTSQDVWYFGFLWACNRFFQSGGWPAIILLVRSMFPPDQHGRILGVSALSFSLGDALIRLFLGHMQKLGLSWQEIFFLAAACAAIFSLPSLVWINPPQTAIPQQFEQTDPDEVPRLRPQYWVLMVQAPLFTWVREVFLTWGVSLLHDLFFQQTPGDASITSVVLPLLGGVSSVFGGIVVDRYRGQRHTIYLVLLVLNAVASCLLAYSIRDRALAHVVVLLGSVSLFSTAPSSWAEGLFIFSVSRPADSGWAVGSVHFAGYLGAVLAGAPVGRLAANRGWVPVFALVSFVSTVNVFLGLLYWFLEPSRNLPMRSLSGHSNRTSPKIMTQDARKRETESQFASTDASKCSNRIPSSQR